MVLNATIKHMFKLVFNPVAGLRDSSAKKHKRDQEPEEPSKPLQRACLRDPGKI